MIENQAQNGRERAVSSLFIVSAVFAFIIFLCIIEYHLVHRTIRDKKNDYRNAVTQVGDRLNFTMREIQRLSHVLMINIDVQGFVTQGKIEPGSSDIQSLIDAQRQLSYIKSVHPAIEALFVYSRTSDYLLEADNAFFDIDTMYSPLFEFKGLNIGQWRSRYLRPVYANKWIGETAVTSNGVSHSVLVFGQTFPLQNSGSNTGKLMMLLKTSYFDALIEPLLSVSHVYVRIADAKNRPLFVRCSPAQNFDIPERLLKTYIELFDEVQKSGHSGLKPFKRTVDGKTYAVFVQPLKSSGMFLTVAVPRTVFLHNSDIRPFVYIPLMLVLLFTCAFLLVKFIPRVLRSRTAENDYAHILTLQTHRVVHDEKDAPSVQETDAKMVKRILSYVEQNYPNPLLNLSQMAADFNIKENFLYYFFRSRIHKSFAQYLEDFRLEKAKTVIEADITEPVNTLAEKCGYANPQTFRRAFKKKYGITPSEFKQRVFAESGEL